MDSSDEQAGLLAVPEVALDFATVNLIYPVHHCDLLTAMSLTDLCIGPEARRDEVVAIWAAQLLEILKLLKHKGVVHRDIKMEHIVVDSNGNLVLIDFQNASMTSELLDERLDNLLLGSLLHLAPEIFHRLEYSHASDLWSVGIVIWELCSASLPWSHEMVQADGCIDGGEHRRVTKNELLNCVA